MKGVGGDRNNMFKGVRLFDRPFQQLLSTHRATDSDPDFSDAKMVAQRTVSPDHIPWRKKRKIVVIRLAGHRVRLQWSDGPVTAAGHVYANNKMLTRIEILSFPDQTGPPIGRIAVGSERVENPDHVAFLCIQFADRMVGQVIPGQHDA